MKQDELMIGDLVMASTFDEETEEEVFHPARITALSDIYELFEGNWNIEWLDDCASESCADLEPIPLTEEILMANAFEYKSATMQTYAEENVFSYEIHDKQFIIELEKCTNEHTTIHGTSMLEDYFCANILSGIMCIKSMSFKYVHELQHALRMCGLKTLADNFKLS